MLTSCWSWLALGLLLSLLELLLPAFFLLSFGLAAILVGLATLAGATAALAVQSLAWLVASLLILWLFRKYLGGTPLTAPAAAVNDGYSGAVGTLEAAAGPGQLGTIRFAAPVLSALTWPCQADVAMQAGETATVIGINGHELLVTRR